MKKFIFLLLVAAIGSCTVTKRHYRSGYYVSWNKVKSSSKNESESSSAFTTYKEFTLFETSKDETDTLKNTFQANYSQQMNIPPDSLKTNGTNQRQKKKPIGKRLAEKHKLKHPKVEKPRKPPLLKRNKPADIDESSLYEESESKRSNKTLLTLILMGLTSLIMAGLSLIFFDSFAVSLVGLCIPIYLGVYMICIVNSKIETRYRSIQRRNLVYHIIALSVCIVIAGSLTLLFLSL